MRVLKSFAPSGILMLSPSCGSDPSPPPHGRSAFLLRLVALSFSSVSFFKMSQVSGLDQNSASTGLWPSGPASVPMTGTMQSCNTKPVDSARKELAWTRKDIRCVAAHNSSGCFKEDSLHSSSGRVWASRLSSPCRAARLAFFSTPCQTLQIQVKSSPCSRFSCHSTSCR